MINGNGPLPEEAVGTGLPNYMQVSDYQVTGVELVKAIPIITVPNEVPTITTSESVSSPTETHAPTAYNSAKKIVCRRYSLYKTRK